MPMFNTSNLWRSRSQAPAPRQPRPAPATAPPPSSSSTPSSRPRSPAPQAQEPVDERTRSLTALAHLAARFHHLDRDTTLPAPSSLVFTPKASPSSPKLAFTPVNAPVHGYEEALTRLLTELDAVDSAGDPAVRQQRKNLVTAVDREAQRVEKWRRDCFEARERGEEGPQWVKAGGQGGERSHEPVSGAQEEAPARAQDGQREGQKERMGSAWAGGPPPVQGHAAFPLILRVVLESVQLRRTSAGKPRSSSLLFLAAHPAPPPPRPPASGLPVPRPAASSQLLRIVAPKTDASGGGDRGSTI
ncbi:hypothetical protein JCM9279_006671 [Rhodotorula babjevae]